MVYLDGLLLPHQVDGRGEGTRGRFFMAAKSSLRTGSVYDDSTPARWVSRLKCRGRLGALKPNCQTCPDAAMCRLW